jgi:hypothetical protein
MRSSLRLLAVATLLLPGCIFVAKDGAWNSDKELHHGKSSLEQRVAALEAELDHCKAACEMAACHCMAPKDGDQPMHGGATGNN